MGLLHFLLTEEDGHPRRPSSHQRGNSCSKKKNRRGETDGRERLAAPALYVPHIHTIQEVIGQDRQLPDDGRDSHASKQCRDGFRPEMAHVLSLSHPLVTAFPNRHRSCR